MQQSNDTKVPLKNQSTCEQKVKATRNLSQNCGATTNLTHSNNKKKKSYSLSHNYNYDYDYDYNYNYNYYQSNNNQYMRYENPSIPEYPNDMFSHVKAPDSIRKSSNFSYPIFSTPSTNTKDILEHPTMVEYTSSPVNIYAKIRSATKKTPIILDCSSDKPKLSKANVTETQKLKINKYNHADKIELHLKPKNPRKHFFDDIEKREYLSAENFDKKKKKHSPKTPNINLVSNNLSDRTPKLLTPEVTVGMAFQVLKKHNLVDKVIHNSQNNVIGSQKLDDKSDTDKLTSNSIKEDTRKVLGRNYSQIHDVSSVNKENENNISNYKISSHSRIDKPPICGTIKPILSRPENKTFRKSNAYTLINNKVYCAKLKKQPQKSVFKCQNDINFQVNLPNNLTSLYGSFENYAGFYFNKNAPLIQRFALNKDRKKFPKSASKLNIFRFDHTMISTLYPNQELYTGETSFKLTEDSDNGFIWYNKILPELELNWQIVQGGINQCRSDHHIRSITKKVLGETFFKHKNINQLHFKWSETLLSMIKHCTTDPESSNLLIIDRPVKFKNRLKEDLQLLTNLGCSFHYEIYAPEKYETRKFDKLTLTILDEIYNDKFSWAKNIRRVTVFQPRPTNLNYAFGVNAKLKAKSNIINNNRFNLEVVYTEKCFAFLKDPLIELNSVYNEFSKGQKHGFGKLALSNMGYAFKLTYESITLLTNYINTVGFLSDLEISSDYICNYSNIFVTSYQCSHLVDQRLQIHKLYEGAILKYGKIQGILYAVYLQIDTDNQKWVYDAPIIIIAKKRSLKERSIRKMLETVEWVHTDTPLHLVFKFCFVEKISIDKFP